MKNLNSKKNTNKQGLNLILFFQVGLETHAKRLIWMRQPYQSSLFVMCITLSQCSSLVYLPTKMLIGR